jgi:hypothetical protein
MIPGKHIIKAEIEDLELSDEYTWEFILILIYIYFFFFKKKKNYYIN